MKTKAGLVFLLMNFAQTSHVLAQDKAYHLGVQDRLRIHVHEWPVLTGEFTIGPDGQITLPLIGEVPATGIASFELADRIAEKLRTKAQLFEKPETAVSVAQYRPFYILGGVERPGEYAFRPSMVVLNAVTIAGGVYRPPRTSDWGFERDSITGRGDLRTVLVRRDELAAKEWRLRAEAAGLEALPPPEGAVAASRFLEEERNIFRSRLERHRNQSQGYAESVTLLEREIVSLQSQSSAADKQKQSVLRELEDTRALISRGLAPAPRILPLERTVAQIEREQKELETSVLRARQQINLQKSLQTGLLDERRNTAHLELQTLASQKKELDERYETASRMIAGSMALSSAPPVDGDEGSMPTLTYTISRPINGRIEELQATETTPIVPGDIVKVFRPQEVVRPTPQAAEREGSSRGVRPTARERLGALQ